MAHAFHFFVMNTSRHLYAPDETALYAPADPLCSPHRSLRVQTSFLLRTLRSIFCVSPPSAARSGVIAPVERQAEGVKSRTLRARRTFPPKPHALSIYGRRAADSL